MATILSTEAVCPRLVFLSRRLRFFPLPFYRPPQPDHEVPVAASSLSPLASSLSSVGFLACVQLVRIEMAASGGAVTARRREDRFGRIGGRVCRRRRRGVPGRRGGIRRLHRRQPTLKVSTVIPQQRLERRQTDTKANFRLAVPILLQQHKPPAATKVIAAFGNHV
uniref:Uncharacterized protein n=1 Tax=Oryza punctata TaxID=4537 RepID=A0A0E0LWU4_ORYPU